MILVILLSLSLLTIFIITNKKIKLTSPLSGFCIVWCLICIFSYCKLLPLYDVSARVYLIVLLGVLSFSIGSLNCSQHSISKSDITIYDSNALRKKFISLQIIAIIIFVFANIPIMIMLRNGMSMDDIYHMRIQMALGKETELNTIPSIVAIMLEYIARPILALSIPFSIVDYLRNKNKQTILFSLVLLLMGYINKANRMDIFMALFTFIYLNAIMHDGIKFKKSFYILVIIAIFSFSTLFDYVTSMRGSSGKINETLYYYSCGSLPFFDTKLSMLEKTHEYTWGFTSLQGVIRPFFQTISNLGFEMPDVYMRATDYANVEDMSYVSNNREHNAFIGPFYFFFCDLGYFGVILFSIISGYLIQKVYYRAMRTQDTLLLVLYAMLFVRGVIFSFYNFLFTYITYGMAILIMILIKNISIKKV